MSVAPSASKMSKNKEVGLMLANIAKFVEIPKKLQEKEQETLRLLDEWSLNRRNAVQDMEVIVNKLNKWETRFSISKTVGSSVGIASGVAVIGAAVLMPPVAATGLIISGAAAFSSLFTATAKNVYCESKFKKLDRMLKKDQELFEKMVETWQEFMKQLKEFSENKAFSMKFDAQDTENNIKEILAGLATSAVVMAVKFQMMSMKRAATSSSKLIVHYTARSAAVFSILIDGATLVQSAKDLVDKKESELGVNITNLAKKLEDKRKRVIENFWDPSKWNVDSDAADDEVDVDNNSCFSTLGNELLKTSGIRASDMMILIRKWM